jgi:hypothetical protein
MIFLASEMVRQTPSPTTLLVLLLDPGSEIRDPGWIKISIRDLGSEINIPDPQHCLLGIVVVVLEVLLISGKSFVSAGDTAPVNAAVMNPMSTKVMRYRIT